MLVPQPGLGGDREPAGLLALGEACSGKTTLVEAIVRTLREGYRPPAGGGIEVGPSEPRPDIFTRTHYYETERRSYEHLDPWRGEDIPSLLLLNRRRIDGLMLVVSDVEGPTRSTARYLELARDTGIHAGVGWINRFTDDEQLAILARDTTREMLDRLGFEPKRFPLFVGSVWKARRKDRFTRGIVREMLTAADTVVSVPVQARALPVFMRVDEIYRREAKVLGSLTRGTLEPGAVLEIAGSGRRLRVRSIRRWIYYPEYQEWRAVRAGGFAGANLELTFDPADGMPGPDDYLVEPGSLTYRTEIEALVVEVRGTAKTSLPPAPLPDHLELPFLGGATAEVLDREPGAGGAYHRVRLRLDRPVILEPGQTLSIGSGTDRGFLAFVLGTGDPTMLR
jgi:translation elongation factor EF-Tu-like GTPase